jgi:hypothetical protein
MWALLRRSGLFIVLYAPLAAMFVAAKWPNGWSTSDLLLLAVGRVGVTGLLLLPLAASFFTAGKRKDTFLTASIHVHNPVLLLRVGSGEGAARRPPPLIIAGCSE